MDTTDEARDVYFFMVSVVLGVRSGGSNSAGHPNSIGSIDPSAQTSSSGQSGSTGQRGGGPPPCACVVVGWARDILIWEAASLPSMTESHAIEAIPHQKVSVVVVCVLPCL